MTEDQASQNMKDLIERMSAAINDLQNGDLSLAAMDGVCGDARELYERLVVIRHKAREQAVGDEGDGQVSGPPLIKLDTSAGGNDRGQITLMDAIQETETPSEKKEEPSKEKKQTKPEKKKDDTSESVAERMEQAPITDLRKAIGLNSKFMFISEIFQDDRAAYERTIDELNEQDDATQAWSHLESNVLQSMDTPPDEEVLERFKLLIERRYA